MDQVSRQLKERASTIHSEDPAQIRREVVEALKESIPCGLALFFRCVKDGEGENYQFTDPVLVGDSKFAAELKPYCEREAFGVPWLPETVNPEEIDNFMRLRSSYGDSYMDYAMNREVLDPMGVADQLRVVLYEGRKMVGWLGLMRRGTSNSGFRVYERNQAAAAVGSLKSALVASNTLEQQQMQGLFAMFWPGGQ